MKREEPDRPKKSRPEKDDAGAASLSDPGRRRFLHGAAVLGGVVAAGGSIASPLLAAPETRPGTTMRYRVLGRTGLRVSEVGFGGYPADDPEVIRYAVERGINYVDTSHCYRGGRSEEVIGPALRGIRDRVVLTTKWCPHHVGRSPRKQVFLDILDGSLKRLGTDHVDLVLNHEVGKNSDRVGVDRLKNPEMFEAFESAKKAGKVHFLGASGHDTDLMDVMHHAVDSGRFDAILCRYSFLDYPDQDRLITKAAAKGVGFIAMKTLAGAKGADLDRFRDRHTSFKQAALKWVLSNASVSNLVISINSRAQVDEYVPASGAALTASDRAVLRDYEETFSTQVCRYCGACTEVCPGDVRVADILRFSMYYHEYKQEQRAVESYAKLVASERAAHCAHCAGMCESACGYDLPIRTLLLKAHETLKPKA